MKNTISLFLFLMMCFTLTYSQEDSTSTLVDKLGLDLLIDDVVVSGQYSPQSVNQSVFEVAVIDAERIEQQGGNTLADVLNQQLNLTVVPNSSTGKSTVQLFGLDGQYFKVLVDNIPLINDEGLGNNTDLTQLTTDGIQQIEIVEGSMGVEYGSDAVSGVINIITKKGSTKKWNLSATIQEETVNNEYAFFEEGRHIQRLRAEKYLTKDLFASVSLNRNQFAGFWNGLQGESHPLNDGQRGYEWLPKEQISSKADFYYGKANFEAFYKFEYYTENIRRYNQTVQENYNASTQTTNPTAQDLRFTTDRIVNHFNIGGDLPNQLAYNVSLSYQSQQRDIEEYNYRILTDEKYGIESNEFESRNALYSKGTLSNLFTSDYFNSQIGYEVHEVNGFQSNRARPGDNSGESIDRKLGTYDVFTSMEITPNEKLSFRPGVRLLNSSIFNSQVAASLSAKYNFQNQMELRAVIGTAPRLPSYNELYYYFVDINHNVQGNENLNPEAGFSTFLHLKKRYHFSNTATRFSQKLSAWYLSVEDRIELTVVSPSPLAFQYNNIDLYKTTGLSLTNQLTWRQLQANLGVAFSGVSKVLDSSDLSNDDYLYGVQGNLTTSYTLPKSKTVVSAFVKYNGPEYQFVQQRNDQGETELVRGKQDGYGWGDVTLQQPFLDNKIQTTLGIRNIFDVDQVNTTAIAGGAHSGPPQSRLLGYGRSFFIKTTFNLN